MPQASARPGCSGGARLPRPLRCPPGVTLRWQRAPHHGWKGASSECGSPGAAHGAHAWRAACERLAGPCAANHSSSSLAWPSGAGRRRWRAAWRAQVLSRNESLSGQSPRRGEGPPLARALLPLALFGRARPAAGPGCARDGKPRQPRFVAPPRALEPHFSGIRSSWAAGRRLRPWRGRPGRAQSALKGPGAPGPSQEAPIAPRLPRFECTPQSRRLRPCRRPQTPARRRSRLSGQHVDARRRATRGPGD